MVTGPAIGARELRMVTELLARYRRAVAGGRSGGKARIWPPAAVAALVEAGTPALETA